MDTGANAENIDSDIAKIEELDRSLCVKIRDYEKGKGFLQILFIICFIVLIQSPFLPEGLFAALPAGLIAGCLLIITIVKNIRFRRNLKKFNIVKLRLEEASFALWREPKPHSYFSWSFWPVECNNSPVQIGAKEDMIQEAITLGPMQNLSLVEYKSQIFGEYRFPLL